MSEVVWQDFPGRRVRVRAICTPAPQQFRVGVAHLSEEDVMEIPEPTGPVQIGIREPGNTQMQKGRHVVVAHP